MKKTPKYLLVLAALAAILLLHHAAQFSESSFPTLEPVGEDVAELRQESLTPLGGTFLLQNHSGERLYYEEGNHIEKYINGKWMNLDSYSERCPPALEYVLEPGGQAEYSSTWRPLWPGRYRYIMPVCFDGDYHTVQYLVCTFRI